MMQYLVSMERIVFVNVRVLFTVCLVVTLVVGGCSGGAPAAPASTQPTSVAATPVPAIAAATPTSIPPSPTVAPTLVPTAIPTAVPTVAPSPTQLAVPTAAPTNTTSAQAVPAGAATGDLNFQLVAQAMAAAKSYRVTVTTQSAATGQPSNIVIDVVKPDRLHATVDSGGGKIVETILIGTTTYFKTGSTWQKSPVPIPAATLGILSSDPQKLLALASANQQNRTITKAGADQVDGTPCQEWVWTPTTGSVGQVGGSICIGLSNNLPLQFKSTDGKTVVKYSNWNDPLTIEAPI
jgi:hypothetical protein